MFRKLWLSFSRALLERTIKAQLEQLAAKRPAMPLPTTNRTERSSDEPLRGWTTADEPVSTVRSA